MPTLEGMLRVLPIVLAFALAIYAVADCARTPKDEMPAKLPKPIWLLIIIVITYIGPLAWIVISRVMRAEENGGSIPASVWSSRNPHDLSFTRVPRRDDTPRDLPPDDDPDFLFRLDAQLYRERIEREKKRKERETRNIDTAHDSDRIHEVKDDHNTNATGKANDTYQADTACDNDVTGEAEKKDESDSSHDHDSSDSDSTN